MLLRELFENDPSMPGTDTPVKQGGAMTNRLRQAALDYLTPFIGQELPFVTVNQVVQALHNQDFGLVVTPSMIMQLLNPTDVPAIDRIEGDRIYLKNSEQEKPEQEETADDQQKDRDRVQDMAQQQAKDAVQQNSNKQGSQVDIPALGKLNKA